MRRALWCSLLLSLAATSAMAQVQVDVRLEKTRYLAGEPVVVVVDVRNVGDEAVAYCECEGDVRLAVASVQRRVPPNIFGCFYGMGVGSGAGAISHPPLLPPGQTVSFRYVLREYDLSPGQYELTASGKAGVRWKYYPSVAPNLPPPPPPKHRETDPVPGAPFERTFPLNIVASTEDELKIVLAPLVSDADGADPMQRHHARRAIIESAPPFLDSLIARFAEESQFDGSAIDALGRIGTTASRTHLKNLFGRNSGARRSTIVLALARIGHRDDVDFLAGVLLDATIDQASRNYAAFGLGYIGGDETVQYLERALAAAPSEVRPSIATALGNTRSPAAVPVLIGMFGNNPARNNVCGALRTLTHRAWCDGTADDPAAKRRQWLRWWNENGSNASIFGPDNCPADSVMPAIIPPAARVAERPAPSGPPRITAPRPGIAAPNSILAVSGYDLGLEDLQSVRVMFTQGSVERAATIRNAGWRSEPVPVEIIEVAEFVLTSISPPRPHPAQIVQLQTGPFAQVAAYVQLTDARGSEWRIATGTTREGISFMLPDEVADGEATVRVGRTENGIERLSTPLRFFVTSGPLPLKPVGEMRPVAPGQWTDLVRDHESEFEVRRADRIEVEFRQGAVTAITEATGPDKVHVEVPIGLAPGAVSVRNRTWIEQTASEWSATTSYRVLERPIPPSIVVIEAGPIRNLVWSAGDAASAFVSTRRGEALVLRGHFPVARAADLRVQLRGNRRTSIYRRRMSMEACASKYRPRRRREIGG